MLKLQLRRNMPEKMPTQSWYNRSILAAATLVLALFLVTSWAAGATGSATVPGKSGFRNPGVYSKIVKGRLYEWIPTEAVNFEICPDGRIRMIAPLTKQSFDGTRACRRFVYDHLHKRLAAEEATALMGEGLMLPPGNYGFAIQWLNASSYDEVFARPWDLTDNPATFAANSAQLDYVNISIIDIDPAVPNAGRVREVRLPADLQRVSWLPHYQLLPYDLALPRDRGFGITRVLWDIPLEQVYKKATHIQFQYSELEHVPNSRKWLTKRALDHTGVLASNEWLIQDQPMDRDFLTASQMDEDLGSRGIRDHAQRAQQVLEGIYRRFQKELNVTSPNQTRLYDDYFSALEGFDNSVPFIEVRDANRLTEGLSSAAAARKRWYDGGWNGECRYFTDGAYDYRNWMEGGYLDSFARTPEGIRLYNEIYNYERKFMAAPDRKVLKFGWSNAEGCNSMMYRWGTRSRLHFDTGDIIRQAEVAWPFHMMVNESFWALLLGHDYVLWHSNVRLISDPHAFSDSWAAGAGKTRWQVVGGAIVDYDPHNPGHPRRIESPKGHFPVNPHMGESGAFAGAWLVSQITTASDRISRSMEYARFSYSTNGGPLQPGYAESDRPRNGALGNAQLSRFGVANYGQANIAESYIAKKPICIYTEGADGAAVIYHNPRAGLTDTNRVVVHTKSGTKELTLVGCDLHVYYLD